ncbi:hypothetical protein Tco_0368844 [Tanacetum coccineum]
MLGVINGGKMVDMGFECVMVLGWGKVRVRRVNWVRFVIEFYGERSCKCPYVAIGKHSTFSYAKCHMHFFHPLLPSLSSCKNFLILMAVIAICQLLSIFFQIQSYTSQFDLGLHESKSTIITAFVARKEWITSSARPGVAVGVALEEEVG